MPDSVTAPDDVSARLQRLEDALTALRPVAADDDKIAERVLAVLTAKAAEQRTNGPAGLVPLTPTRTVYPIPDGPLLPPGMTEMPPGEPSLRAWLIGNVLTELRLMVRLYLDPRYRLSRLAQFGVPVILGLFVFNWLFWAGFPIPVMSHISERLMCVVLGVALYKILAREVLRYRQVLDYLSRYGYT